MIFSEEKKPITPGFYWFCGPDIEPIHVFRDFATNLRAEWYGSGIDHDVPNGLWGDKIETPTVELKE